MTIRCRPMRRRDVSACVRILAAHPVAGRPRYGENLDQLQSTWLRLLDRKAFWPVVFEELHEAKAQTVGSAASVFVTDDFLRELKTVSAANTDGGLNLVLWHLSIDPEEANLSAYLRDHPEEFRPYSLKTRGEPKVRLIS